MRNLAIFIKRRLCATANQVRLRLPAGRYRYIYAGDIPRGQNYPGAIGLSINRADERHIKHDITRLPLPIRTGSVDVFQSEDVIEHIEYRMLFDLVKDIHRTLRRGGVFRLSVPDYRSELLRERSEVDSSGRIIFDPGGGGFLSERGVEGGGHVWFPVFELVKDLLETVPFSGIHFLHYFDPNGFPRADEIDYSIGYVARTPDHDKRVENPRVPLSLVVDCWK